MRASSIMTNGNAHVNAHGNAMVDANAKRIDGMLASGSMSPSPSPACGTLVMSPSQSPACGALVASPSTDVDIDTPTPSTTPVRRSGSMSRDAVEEAFHRNIIGMLNKRGYNVRDSSAWGATPCGANNHEYSETSTISVSMASTSSTMSSILLGLREPHHGQGPLHLAVRKGDLHVIDALLENECADELINMQDDNGNTALHFAAGAARREECEVLVAKLLQAGADVRTPNAQGLTPIAVHLLIARVDNPAVMVALLDHGADPNTPLEGGTLLHLAARRKFPLLCTVLVSYGASLTALDDGGLMCYEVATPRLKAAMLRGIECAPPLLPIQHWSRCMHCHNTVRHGRHRVSQSLKRFFGLSTASAKWNCYHCGLLFCSQCLRATQVADLLPPDFSRSRLDDLSYVKLCPMCRLVLKEKTRPSYAPNNKRPGRQSFDCVSMVATSMPAGGHLMMAQPRNSRFESMC